MAALRRLPPRVRTYDHATSMAGSWAVGVPGHAPPWRSCGHEPVLPARVRSLEGEPPARVPDADRDERPIRFSLPARKHGVSRRRTTTRRLTNEDCLRTTPEMPGAEAAPITPASVARRKLLDREVHPGSGPRPSCWMPAAGSDLPAALSQYGPKVRARARRRRGSAPKVGAAPQYARARRESRAASAGVRTPSTS